MLSEVSSEGFTGFLFVSDVLETLEYLSLFGNSDFLSIAEHFQGIGIRFISLHPLRLVRLGSVGKGNKLSRELLLELSPFFLLEGNVGTLVFFSLLFLLLIMVFAKLGVDSVRVISKKGVVVSFFYQLPFLQHDNGVGVLDGGESVGNHKRGHLTELGLHFVDRLLDLSFVDFVKSAGGLVEDQQTGFLDKGASESNSLLLTAGKLASSAADVSVHALRVFAHETPRVGLAQGFFDLSVSSIGLTHQDVVLDRGVEKDGLLTDISNLLSVVTEVDCFQIHSINEYPTVALAVAGVVEALGQLDGGGLARAGRPDDGGGLAEFELVRKALHNGRVWTRGVEEVNILELDLTLNDVLLDICRVLVNHGHSVNNFKRELSGGLGLVDGSKCGASAAEGNQCEENTEEDGKAVTGKVVAPFSVVIVGLVNPNGADKEAVTVA